MYQSNPQHPRAHSPARRAGRCDIARATHAAGNTQAELGQALDLLAGAADRETMRATDARGATTTTHLPHAARHAAAARELLAWAVGQ